MGTMDNLERNREEFGRLVARLRNDRSWTLKDLRERSSLQISALSAIENGKRVVGGTVAEALAEAFKLKGQERNDFLLAAAATTVDGRLVGTGKRMPPAVVNYVTQRLEKEGISQSQVAKASVVTVLKTTKLVALIRKNFESQLEDWVRGIAVEQPQWPMLELSLTDGRTLACMLVTAET
jgi:transcriptional regulator with XRE-family HTH domain